MVLQAEFYTFVTNMEGAGFYVLEDDFADRILHFCHKNVRSRVLPIGG